MPAHSSRTTLDSSAEIPIEFGDRGYAYTVDLCAAIEAYTQDEVDRNPDAFVYRGVDLRRAIERLLYIRGINSPVLFHMYCEGHPSRTLAAQMDPREILVARFLIGGQQTPETILKKPRRSMAALQLGWLKHRLFSSALRTEARRGRKSTGCEAPILFTVVHPKLADFLRPVTDRLDRNSYAYLVTEGDPLEQDLAARGVPLAQSKASRYSYKSTFIQPSLRFFSSLASELDFLMEALDVHQPSCVVVAEGMAPRDALTASLCRKSGIPVYCVQHGWSPVIHSGFRHMDFDEMFVWGEDFVEMLAPYNPGQQFRVTGTPALASPEHNKGELPIERTAISFFLQAPCALLSASGYVDFVDLAIWSAQTFPTVPVIVREHPSYPVPGNLRARMEKLPNLRLQNARDMSLSEAIDRSALVVSVFSTVLLEALPFGTVPLICAIGSLPRYNPDLAAKGAAMEVRTIEEARREIASVVADPHYLDSLRAGATAVADRYFANVDSAQTIADVLGTAAGLEK